MSLNLAERCDGFGLENYAFRQLALRTIRAFYWHARVRARASLWFRRHVRRRPEAWREFAVGNAGDIFALNLLEHFFPQTEILNIPEGPRILCVGSVAHNIAQGDVLCGIGSQNRPFPDIDPKSVYVHALRGPLTEKQLRQEGYDTTTLKWFGDPGLMISKMLPPRQPENGRVIFIPHYREYKEARKITPKGIKLVSIDDEPLQVGRQIQDAELVYSSSLHGIIFAHALGRPAVFVKPATKEPLSKFDDYYLGVGLSEPKPIDSIADLSFTTAPKSPATLSMNADEIYFPTHSILEERGILV